MIIEKKRESANPGKKDFYKTIPTPLRYAPESTNRALAGEKEFIQTCREFQVAPTPRQLSKFRNKKGLLYKRLVLKQPINPKDLGHAESWRQA